jgi:predicted MFS family arabinose efflux permease
MVLAMAVGSFTTFAIGALAPLLRTDLDLTRAEVGGLSTAFFVAGGVSSLLFGGTVHRVGGRRMLFALFCVSTLSFVAMASSAGYAGLVAATAFGGLSLAAANPATNQLISALIPRGRQGLLVGLKQAGGPFGGFLVGVTMPLLATAFGWRGALLSGAVLALVGIAATAGYVPRTVGLSSAVGEEQSIRLRSSRSIIAWLSAYAVLMGAGMASVTAYLPLYAHEKLGLSVTRAGMLAAVIGFAGMVSRVLWARRAERSSSVAAHLCILGLIAAFAVWLILIAEGTYPRAVWVGAACFGLSAVAWNAIGMLAIVRDIGPAMAGRASGIVLFGFYLGLVASPIAFGMAVDRLGSYRPGWVGVMGVCTAASAIAGAWHLRLSRSANPFDSIS